jgi:hypothetical protein
MLCSIEMAMSLNKQKHTDYRVGKGAMHVLIDAPHATHPQGESPTGEIANHVSLEVGCHCIIGTVSRTEADLNRPPERSGNPQAIYEYRDVIRHILDSSGLINSGGTVLHPFLHLQIHGMKDRSLDPSKRYDLDVEIGTKGKSTCSPTVHDWIVQEFKDWSGAVEERKNIVIGANERFTGDLSKGYHRHGDDGEYSGYGENFHTVQIEFTKWLRSEHQTEIENVLKHIAQEFESAEPERRNAA